MNIKNLLTSILVISLVVGLVCFNSVSAKKTSAVKMAPETIESSKRE